jgi:hypothetical protein
MRSVALPFLITILAFSFAGAQKATWKSDPKQAANLADFANAASYQIRPPKGYQSMNRKGPSGEMAYAWAGVTRQDGTRAMLMVAIAPMKKGDKTSLDDLVAGAVGSVGKARTGFHKDKPEYGTMAGLKFVRVGWSGKMGSFTTKGFHYVAKDGKQVVILWSQDVVPGGESALKLAEASIRTFRKG